MLPPVLTVSFTLTVSHGGSNQRAGLFLLRPELRWMQLVLDLSTSGFINVGGVFLSFGSSLMIRFTVQVSNLHLQFADF